MKIRLLHRFATLTALTCTLLGAAGCYDETELLKKLADQEARLAVLEQACSQINTNIASLQVILNAIQEKDYITSTAPYIQNGKLIGYVLTFSRSGSIILFQGQDGADGKNGADGRNGRDGADGKDGRNGDIPVISARQDSDGCWYWTLNGEWLLDAQGDKLQAAGADGKDGKNGADGKDGKDGITPQLKIAENTWYLSVDGGASWTRIGTAVGKDGKDGLNGDTLFKSIDISDLSFVSITLVGSSEPLTIPRDKGLSIKFSQNPVVIPTNYDALHIEYEVTAPGDTIVSMDVVPSGGAKALVVARLDKKQRWYMDGDIVIASPTVIHTDFTKVIVLVSSTTRTIMRTLPLVEAKLIRMDTDRVDIEPHGGTVEFNYRTNITGNKIVIPPADTSWCKLKDVYLKTDHQDPETGADFTIVLSIGKNTGTAARQTTVEVQPPFSGAPIPITFTINQDS